LLVAFLHLIVVLFPVPAKQRILDLEVHRIRSSPSASLIHLRYHSSPVVRGFTRFAENCLGFGSQAAWTSRY
jgi:hypothetical protein